MRTRGAALRLCACQKRHYCPLPLDSKLTDNRYVSVEEQIAMFLAVVTRNEQSGHSGAISAYIVGDCSPPLLCCALGFLYARIFNSVLWALVCLYEEVVKNYSTFVTLCCATPLNGHLVS
jgi:hypothetical protein